MASDTATGRISNTDMQPLSQINAEVDNFASFLSSTSTSTGAAKSGPFGSDPFSPGAFCLFFRRLHLTYHKCNVQQVKVAAEQVLSISPGVNRH